MEEKPETNFLCGLTRSEIYTTYCLSWTFFLLKLKPDFNQLRRRHAIKRVRKNVLAHCWKNKQNLRVRGYGTMDVNASAIYHDTNDNRIAKWRRDDKLKFIPRIVFNKRNGRGSRQQTK